MYHFSDSESVDSDDGIRFKTVSIRNKADNKQSTSENHRSSYSDRSSREKRRRSRSPSHRSRRRSSDRSRSSRHRSKADKKERSSRKEDSDSLSLSDEEIKRKEYPLLKKRSPEYSRDKYKSRYSSERHIKERDSEKAKDKHRGQKRTSAEVEKCDKSSSSSRHIVNRNECKSKSDVNNKNNADSPEVILGPALPPHLKHKPNETKEEKCEEKLQKIVGPSLPPDLKITVNDNKVNTGSPVLSDGEINQVSDEEDDDTFGPLPPGMSSKSAAHIELEERALQIKLSSLNPEETDTKTREEWMLELPEVRAANLGLGPRQFRSKAGPDMADRSSWTDTPKDKEKRSHHQEKKVDLKKEAETREIRRRDRQQEQEIKKHKEKRGKSLVEIHKEKLKEKKQDDGGRVRRPFNRDVDLKVNRFDEAQKKAILKKAQLLDDRFSRGQSKFL